MDLITDEFSILNTFFRSIPTTLPIITFTIFIITKKMVFFYFALGMIILNGSVHTIKNYIFKPVGDYLAHINNNDPDLPIIGRFSRPDGAKNTGSFYVSETNFSKTQGMPSGHSMIAGFTSMLLFNYYVHKYNIKKENQPKILLLCLCFTFYTMYSRVLMNCHTTQQTIIGAGLGCIIGNYYYTRIILNSKIVNITH